jgi:hypothetical protein
VDTCYPVNSMTKSDLAAASSRQTLGVTSQDTTEKQV